MASKTLLDTLKAVTGETGLPQPAVVVSSQVLTDVQLKYLAIAAGEELLDIHDWQSLLRKHTVNVVAGTSRYPLPADYHHIVNRTAFNGLNDLNASPSPMKWARLQSGEKRFRIVGDMIEVFEPENNVGAITFDYISSYFVIDGTLFLNKPEFTLDSDKTVYHSRLFTSMVKLKLLQVKSLDSRAAAEDFNTALAAAIASDTPSPVLSFDGENRLMPQEWEY